MTLFWIIAAVMVLVALALVIPSVLGRSPPPDVSVDLANHREQLFELTNALQGGEIDQEEFNAARTGIGNRLVVELSLPAPTTTGAEPVGKLPAIAIAALIPIASVALYLWLGSTQSLQPQAVTAAPVAGETASVEQMVASLAQRLRSQPNDPQGWLMLARSYSVMERFIEARDAYARAHELIGDQAGLLVDYAQAIAITEDNRLTGKPAELLATALTLEPAHQKGLWLAGFAAHQSGDDTRAVALWRQLAGQLAAGSEELAMVEDMLSQTGGTPGSEPAPVETTVAANTAIEVTVSLEPALASRVTGDETLFIFARAVNGPPMPLAIQKRTASELPLTIILDDTMHMVPAFKLSTFPTVTVGARISRSGNATPSSGDLQGLVSPVDVAGAAVVNLVIEEVVD